MKLIRINTKGFKSFADRIILDFDGGIVGVVGPNGSGKSNINDAIKWVLGEQSIKSLRGDSSEDVIFSGSKSIAASPQAEVSLTFDNSEKKLSLPHDKITITRQVIRGKKGNKYFINGEEARLRDIKEIAMESGIGKSSLAIISQGTISDIAEATPEQRRGVFEEAAGISKYKARKKEALRKLDSTTVDLEKISIAVMEMERQLNPLKRQAEKAKIYLAKRDELKDVEISLIVKDVDYYSKIYEKLNSELEDVLSSKTDLEAKIDELANNIQTKNNNKLKLDKEVHEITEKLENISKKLRDIEIRNSNENQRRKMLIDGEIQTTSENRLLAMEEELNSLFDQIQKYKIWEEKSTKEIAGKKEETYKLESVVSSRSFEEEMAKNKLQKLKARLSLLIDYRDNKTNLFKGVKTVVDNSDAFPGYKGLVSDLIEVDDQNKLAIQSILSSSTQHVVVDNPDTAVKAINFLKNNKGGRATFIPLSSIQPKSIFDQHLMVAQSQEGFVDIASNLVQTNPQHAILKRFLLGNIVVADTVENASKIASILNNKYMVVSLDGDIIRTGGVMSGGQRNRQQGDMFGIEDQIKKIESAIEPQNKIISEKADELMKLRSELAEGSSIISSLNMEIVKIREKRSFLENEFGQLKINFESSSNKKFESKKEDYIEETEDLLASEKSSLTSLLNAKRHAALAINEDLSRFTTEKIGIEKTLRDIVDSHSSKIADKTKAEFVLNSSRKRLAEEYEMTIELAREKYELEMEVDKAREIVSALRREIKELGPINLESIEMYEEINERHITLSASRDELFEAQQTIISAIDEMDQIITSKLDETVKMVNEEFNNVFRTMFGGGFAQVKYTMPSNLLETGVDVVAQPPGKNVKNLRLFSGGEKALIAISLLFAILKSKPLPLCILDEVEAALDEANVIRFASYLQELKHQTQFLVVTHRTGTMSRVDHLFGASMQNRGVTSFFTVRLEEAKQMIDK